MRYVFMLLTILLFSSPSLAADTTYSNPGVPPFTLLVPDGWTAAQTEGGVKVSRGASSFTLGLVAGAAPPGAMLVQIRPQLQRQWKEFREVEAGQLTFGGMPGTYAVYSGIPPSGTRSFQRIATMTDGQQTFVAFEGSSAAEYEASKPVLLRIEQSLRLGPPG